MDRKPLLYCSENEDEWYEDMKLSKYIGQVFRTKNERIWARIIHIFVVFLLVSLLIKQYKDSMRILELTECSDVLADCENFPLNDTVLPPYYDYLQDFTISRRYNLSLCLIPKVMSTIATATFCYLEDPVAFTDSNRSISKEKYVSRFCPDNEKKSFDQVQRSLRHQHARNIILVRDPFDRFISGFTNKCVQKIKSNLCHGCGTDMRCFLRKEFRRLKRISMLFPVYSEADTHFAPQTWFCDMKNTLKNSTLIRYGNTDIERVRMITDFENVFRKNQVAESEIGEVRKELSKGKSHHSTSGSSMRAEYEKLVREDEAIRRAIIRFYYYDFLILGYKM